MEYRRLGRSGIKVSPICLGTQMFGASASADASAKMIDRAREAGVNFIDTADAYAGGESERVVGAAIKKDRGQWILATKGGLPVGKGANGNGTSRHWVYQAVDASLARLGTDYIDIYYLQVEDPGTRLEETVGAFADMMKAGKIRYFGLSNYKAWRVAEICNIADRMHIDRPVVSQPSYNAANRTPEVEHLSACDYYGVGVAVSSPLARGVLTGKYKPGAEPAPGSRVARNDQRMITTEYRQETMILAQKIQEHVKGRGGMTAGQFATLWVLNNRFVTSAIAGPRTDEQWAEYLGALQHKFTAEDEALVNAIVPPGTVSTYGYNDPVFPIEGRVARGA
jgi:aryl-alcohol dehydrogenase-like predicted oxidoreductase